MHYEDDREPQTSREKETLKSLVHDSLRWLDTREPNSNADLVIERIEAMQNAPPAEPESKKESSKKQKKATEGTKEEDDTAKATEAL